MDINKFCESHRVSFLENGCWNWTKAKSHNGYGRVTVKGKTRRAHRVALSMSKGKIPDGKMVCHSCDNPSGINPSHLFLGTALDNVRDKISKGRMKTGEDHGKSKLSESQVLEILKDSRYQYLIAKDYGLAQSTVQRIKSGRHWKSIQRV